MRGHGGLLPLCAALAALSLTAGGCLKVFEKQTTASRDAYIEFLDKWTRAEKVYYEGETHFFITATFQSKEFLDAYLKYYSEMFELSPAAAEDQKNRLFANAAGYYEFTVAVFTEDPRWHNLADKDSIWRIRLVNEHGEELAPSYVNAIRTPDPNMKTLFPYISNFDKVHYLGFARMTDSGLPFTAEGGRTFSLKVVSGLGKAELKWELEPGE